MLGSSGPWVYGEDSNTAPSAVRSTTTSGSRKLTFLNGGFGHCPAVVLSHSPRVLTPNLTSDVDDKSQLVDLVVERDWISRDHAGKAALGAEGEPLVRHQLTGVVEPSLEVVGCFHLGCFAAHQAQDNDFVVGTLAKGVKSPDRSLSYSRKKSIDVDIVEQSLGDVLIASLR